MHCRPIRQTMMMGARWEYTDLERFQDRCIRVERAFRPAFRLHLRSFRLSARCVRSGLKASLRWAALTRR